MNNQHNIKEEYVFFTIVKKQFSFLFLIILIACSETKNTDKVNKKTNSQETQQVKTVRKNEPILPIVPEKGLDENKIALGRILFFSKSLSRDNDLSCASCHILRDGGDDNRSVSVGTAGAKGKFNSQSVFNASRNFKHFWNGRANSLAEQITSPIYAKNELGSNWESIISKLSKNNKFHQQFKKVYPQGVNEESIKDALIQYLKSLITPARFDRYLQGDDNAITKEELDGYNLFKKYGCVTCHQGENVGGNMFQKFGIAGNYFEDRRDLSEEDYGRYTVTKDELDKFVFRVPSLRNVTLTAPYFHNGSVKELEKAIKIMSKYQLGKEMSEKHAQSIIKFLGTLTGENIDKFTQNENRK